MPQDTRLAAERLLEEFLDVLPAVLGALDHRVADALGGLLHARPDRPVAALLGALLHLLGRLVHPGLVGGAGRPAAQDRDGQEGRRDPQRAHLPCPCHGFSPPSTGFNGTPDTCSWLAPFWGHPRPAVRRAVLLAAMGAS